MYTNEYIAFEMHRIRVHDFEKKNGIGRAVSEAIEEHQHRTERRRARRTTKPENQTR